MSRKFGARMNREKLAMRHTSLLSCSNETFRMDVREEDLDCYFSTLESALFLSLLPSPSDWIFSFVHDVITTMSSGYFYL